MHTSLQPALLLTFVEPKHHLRKLVKLSTHNIQVWGGVKLSESTAATFTFNDKSLRNLRFSRTSGVTQSGAVLLWRDWTDTT